VPVRSSYPRQGRPGAGNRPASRLAKLFADERAFAWRAEPLAASAEGIRTFDDRLASVTPAAQARKVRADRRFLERLGAIPRSRLGCAAAGELRPVQFMLSARVTFSRYREWRMPLNSDSGFHSEVLFMHEYANPRTVADYENFIARLHDVPRYFDENIANMREGIRDGFTLPAAILDGVAQGIAGEQYDDPEKMPLWQPFAKFPPAVPESERARLKAAGRAALAKAVIPAYAKFQRFSKTSIGPAARPTIAAHAFAEGRDYYADLVRYFTTLPDATPEGVHEIGVREWRAFARRWKRSSASSTIRETLPDFSRSCAAIRSFARSRETSSCARRRGLRRKSTASCRRCSASCRGCRMPSSRCPLRSRPITRLAATTLVRSARQASTG
jgi:uncharacterized protein (DUF885 family)